MAAGSGKQGEGREGREVRTEDVAQGARAYVGANPVFLFTERHALSLRMP